MKNFPLTSSVFIGLLFVSLVPAARAVGPDARLTVRADKPGAEISPLLYGIFFEEINRAGDGGLYAEMLQNRSFEDGPTPLGWKLLAAPGDGATISLDTSRPLNANNPTSLKMAIAKVSGRVGICNEGFKGAPYDRRGGPRDRATPFWEAADGQKCGLFVEKGKDYRFSMYVRSHDLPGPVEATIEKPNGTVLAQKTFHSIGRDWQKCEATLTAAETESNARMVVSSDKVGTLYVDMVSLMPKDTFKGHGLRKDLTQMLADMHPAFVRFPGGCYVEGDVLAERFQWKKTLGDVAQRPGHYNLWGYYSSDGLGYHEYLQLCEDIGAEPLFVINCGMAHRDHVPMDEMDEYVQDALDAIEYANGPADSKWGGLRAKAGHPAPFHLRLMEIGNENGGPIYSERYALFYDAIKERYPDVKLVVPLWNGCRRTAPSTCWTSTTTTRPSIFLGKTRQYDAYDRKNYKVYVGEYAVTSGCGKGNLIAAVAEAAFMTGMERNGDVVAMSSYAPLFVHPAWKTWNPNAIVFDSSRVYGTPSYHVQALFAANRADRAVGVSVDAGEIDRKGKIGVATWRTRPSSRTFALCMTARRCSLPTSARGWSLGGPPAASGKSATARSARSATARASAALAGDPKWTDYTLTLKARKLSGNEGFLILFNNMNMTETYWWNLGGWGNTLDKLEGAGLPEDTKPSKIETGRWYDLKVEVQGRHVTCYLDGKVIHRVTRQALPSVAATAGLTAKGDELIVKVVNGGGKDLDTQVSLRGLPAVESTALMYCLTGRGPGEENSFAQPRNVAVQQQTIEGVGPEFRHAFPAYSVTVFRVKVK